MSPRRDIRQEAEDGARPLKYRELLATRLRTAALPEMSTILELLAEAQRQLLRLCKRTVVARPMTKQLRWLPSAA